MNYSDYYRPPTGPRGRRKPKNPLGYGYDQNQRYQGSYQAGGGMGGYGMYQPQYRYGSHGANGQIQRHGTLNQGSPGYGSLPPQMPYTNFGGYGMGGPMAGYNSYRPPMNQPPQQTGGFHNQPLVYNQYGYPMTNY